uniref:HTH_48 domain-containing protein n=1 Tax=Strongyloides stercoralis TaxID=6248 RepID=A0A0K0EB80_STRER
MSHEKDVVMKFFASNNQKMTFVQLYNNRNFNRKYSRKLSVFIKQAFDQESIKVICTKLGIRYRYPTKILFLNLHQHKCFTRRLERIVCRFKNWGK